MLELDKCDVVLIDMLGELVRNVHDSDAAISQISTLPRGVKALVLKLMGV